jgi:hypothetical protein
MPVKRRAGRQAKDFCWTNLWGADRVMRYDGQGMQVVPPYFRARKVAVMTLRSEGKAQDSDDPTAARPALTRCYPALG